MHAEELVRLLLDAPVGFVVYRPTLDDDGVQDLECVWINYRSAELIGAPIERLIGMSAKWLFSNDWPKMQALYNTVIMTGEPCTYARTHRWPDGSEFDYQGVAWYDPPYIAVVVRDVEGEVFPVASREEIQTVLRLSQHRTEQTLALAKLLERQRPTVPKN